jgi:hypothetical protein
LKSKKKRKGASVGLVQGQQSQEAMMSTLQRLMCQHWLTCDQAVEILSLFKHTADKTETAEAILPVPASPKNGSFKATARASMSFRKGSAGLMGAAITAAGSKLSKEEKEAKLKERLAADRREILYGSRGLPGPIKCARSITKNTVEAVIMLFSRLLDISNFDVVLNVLPQDEQQEVVLRLGWLNIFNPVKAERKYCFDFTIGEHRELFGMLLTLSKVEKGEEHTTDEWFRRPGEKETVPNWQFHDLGSKWSANMPTSLPDQGFAWLTYTSFSNDPNKRLAPNYEERRKMMIRCLCAPNNKQRMVSTKEQQAAADNADANLLSKVLHGEDIQLVHVPRVPAVKRAGRPCTSNTTGTSNNALSNSPEKPIIPKLALGGSGAVVTAVVRWKKRALVGQKSAATIPGRFSTLGRMQRLGSIDEHG